MLQKHWCQAARGFEGHKAGQADLAACPRYF